MKYPIVMLHGWGSSPERWKAVIALLQENEFTVYAPYLPGFKPSEPVYKPYTIDDYSLWLKNYINNLKSPKVILIGHSHGGRIIARYMNKYGQKVSKIILISAAGLPQKLTFAKRVIKSLVSKYSKNCYKLLPKWVYNILQQFLYKILGESDYVRLNNAMKTTMNNMLNHDSTNDYKSIKVPTLLLWGNKDSYTPIAMGKTLSSLIQNSSLVTIPDGKHGLHLTHPKLLTRYILDYLNNQQ